MVQFYPIVTGPLGENCYLVWEDERVWIIDPGMDDEEIVAEIEARHLTPDAILLTHGHFDHLGALDALLKRWPNLPVVMRAEELDWAFSHPFNQYPPFYMHQQRPANVIAAQDSYTSGGMTAKLLHTPGHTPGCMCILIERPGGAPLCFTGDTLFQGSAGRTDLPGGNFLQLTKSLKFLAETLPPETTVLSGHGDASTMDWELRYNPYLRGEAEEDF
jgi:glyoxylase-like metal-dependent hydrolase (beta-lactamase superfamily II)